MATARGSSFEPMVTAFAPALIVSGSQEQAHFWFRESGVRADSGYVYASSEEVVRGRVLVGEVVFAGQWYRAELELVLDVWRRYEPTPAPLTYVTDCWGSPLLAKLPWARWRAESNGRMTSWHLGQDASYGWGHVQASQTACGIKVPVSDTASGLRTIVLRPDDFASIERYGPPPGACGICAHASLKYPPGTEEIRQAGERAAALAMDELRGTREAADALYEKLVRDSLFVRPANLNVDYLKGW